MIFAYTKYIHTLSRLTLSLLPCQVTHIRWPITVFTQNIHINQPSRRRDYMTRHGHSFLVFIIPACLIRLIRFLKNLSFISSRQNIFLKELEKLLYSMELYFFSNCLTQNGKEDNSFFSCISFKTKQEAIRRLFPFELHFSVSY